MATIEAVLAAATIAPPATPTQVIRLENEHLTVIVLPELGAGLASVEYKHPSRGAIALMRQAPVNPTWFNDLSCYLLAPWSNRVANASFMFGGKQHQLLADWKDATAIHGLVKDKPWAVLDRSPVSARLRYVSMAGPHWPWSYLAHARYELQRDSLLASVTITNTDADPFPAGAGFHPFWVRQLRDPHRQPLGERALLKANVTRRYVCKKMIPTGETVADEACAQLARGVPIDSLELDDVFIGGGARIAWPGSGLELIFTASPNAGHTVVYSPPKAHTLAEFFCVEPVTMVNDGFNLLSRGESQTGVVTVAPGETMKLEWRIETRYQG